MHTDHGKLDPVICERARSSRDARFDGQFFFAVSSTGIFCRPICPAHIRRPENVRFFPSAASAMDHGFRPCMRCRPELAPDHAFWPQQPPLVQAALHLIDQGFLDQASVADLAACIGVSARHLRRLFATTLGTSPKALALTRRILRAKQLLSDSELPLQQIATAAGFGSVRRFNSAFATAYGRPPRDLRAKPERRPGRHFELRLPYRRPYHWPHMQQFLAGRAIAGLEQVTSDSYQRVFEFQAQPGWFSVNWRPADDHFQLQVEHASPAALLMIAQRCQRMFDLAAVPEAVQGHLAASPRLANIIKAHPGLRLPAAWDRFELCVRAIVGQQISVAAARTILGRITARHGRAVQLPQGCWRLFPPPDAIAEGDLNGLGLTGRRIDCLRRLAGAVRDRTVDLHASGAEIDQALAAIPGIGPWTRAYIRLRALHDPDALPSGDIVLRKAMATDGQPLSARALEQQAQAWRPWRGYAVIMLWHHASTGTPP